MACTDPPPANNVTGMEGECAGTASGRACLVLHVFVDDGIRDEVEPGRLAGTLHWGVYAGGDVGLFGPRDGVVEKYGGDTEVAVDLSAPGSFYDVVVPDVPAVDYQVLGFLGPADTAGEAVSGDPVTFPSDPFPTIPDRRNSVDIALNYVR